MEERRRYIRLDTRLKINYRVLPDLPPARDSESLDIGGGGIRLFLAEPLEVGTFLELEILLLDEPQPIRCQGKIVWIEEFSIYQGTQEGKKESEVGVEFSDISFGDRDRIIKYVILGYAGKGKGSPQ